MSQRMSGEVRLIGGQWRRSRLPVLDRPDLRPTPDRVRETLFNWLGQTLDGWRVLDAFAGTGALGLEAGSRGAAHVRLLESDRGLVQSLRDTVRRLQATTVTVEQADARTWFRQAALTPSAADSYDLILLDPPFGASWLEEVPERAWPLLRPGGWLYLEAPSPWSTGPDRQVPLKTLRAGAVHAHLWRKPISPLEFSDHAL